MKTFFKLLVALFIISAASAQETQKMKIAEVEYNIEGNTSEHSLQTKLKIEKERIFNSIEELELYIKDIENKLENLRAFDEIYVEYEEKISIKDGIFSYVLIKIHVKDSKHLLIIPYPKYSTSEGFSFKIKSKDTNFFGSLEDFSADLSYGAKTKPDGSFDKNIFGASCDFSVPFRIGIFDAYWVNDHRLRYSPGETTADWKLDTGIRLELPFEKFSVINEFNQRFIRYLDEDIEDYDGRTFFVEKETFFVEHYNLSLPYRLIRAGKIGDLTVSPFADFSFAWSPDSSKYEDLLHTTELFAGLEIDAGRVNWKKNFRDGMKLKVSSKIGRDFTNENLVSKLKGELFGHKAFIFEFENEKSFEFAINFNLTGFWAKNTTEYFGEKLRGVYDKQYFATEGFTDRKSTVSTEGIILNVDAPFKITRIYWEDLPSFENINFLRYFDMEIQAGPFVDMALFDNKASGTSFELQDGFLTIGGEVIVYPLHWKGIQVRGSFGYDLSSVITMFNKDWRNSDYSSFEAFIGIGLHY